MVAVFEIMAFEQVAGNPLNYHENTFYEKSTCYQTVLGFQISLTEMFSSSIFLL